MGQMPDCEALDRLEAGKEFYDEGYDKGWKAGYRAKEREEEEKKKITNADLIREMSDERLARFIVTCVEYFGCNDPDDGCLFDFGEVELCYDCVFEWLTRWREKQEAE